MSKDILVTDLKAVFLKHNAQLKTRDVYGRNGEGDGTCDVVYTITRTCPSVRNRIDLEELLSEVFEKEIHFNVE